MKSANHRVTTVERSFKKLGEIPILNFYLCNFANLNIFFYIAFIVIIFKIDLQTIFNTLIDILELCSLFPKTIQQFNVF